LTSCKVEVIFSKRLQRQVVAVWILWLQGNVGNAGKSNCTKKLNFE